MSTLKKTLGRYRRMISMAMVILAVVIQLALLLSVSAFAQTDLSSAQAQADRVQAEIDTINLQAEQAVERYNQADTELQDTLQRISDNEASLIEASNSLAAAQARLDARLKNIYRGGSMSFVDVIVNTSSWSEFLTRMDMLGRISDQDKEDVEEVLKYKAEVEETQAQLESDRQKQEELVQTLAAEKTAVESQLASRQAVLDGVEGEIAEILAQQQAVSAAASSSGGATVGASGNSQTNPSASGPAPAPVIPRPPMPAPPPPSSGGAVSIAMQYLGVPYVWGGASPSGFDCSGLVMYVYAQMGVYLPHSAAAQFYSGTPISTSQLAPGDLVFFGSPISHVGIYIGGGSMIHAPFEGATVSITSIWSVGGYSGACRI